MIVACLKMLLVLCLLFPVPPAPSLLPSAPLPPSSFFLSFSSSPTSPTSSVPPPGESSILPAPLTFPSSPPPAASLVLEIAVAAVEIVALGVFTDGNVAVVAKVVVAAVVVVVAVVVVIVVGVAVGGEGGVVCVGFDSSGVNVL